MPKRLAFLENSLRLLPDIKPPEKARVFLKNGREGDDAFSARDADEKWWRAEAGHDGCRVVRRILDEGLANPVEGKLSDGLDGAFATGGGDGGPESLAI